VEGSWENELASVYTVAPVKQFKKGESIFADAEQNDSFFVLLDGTIQLTAKLNGQSGRPGVFNGGDCVSPLPQTPGVTYGAEAVADTRILEIPPSVLRQLPDKTQLCIYKLASAASGRISAQLHSANSEATSKNLRLSQFILNQSAARNASVQAKFVQEFIKNMRRLPPYATDLAVKLFDDQTSVQEVVERIGCDPSLVAVVLRTVNSAQYGFGKKIESFYHACMILGFNNIYNLLMREAAQSAMPVTRETTRIFRHSSLISVFCFEMATMLSEPQSQTAATIGLLHDLGKIVQVVMRNTHPNNADFIDTLDSAKLGAALLRSWGIPERICKIVEFQQHPEFMSPDVIAPEYRRDTATLHIAHVLEMLLVDKPLDPCRTIYTTDYMAMLGFGSLKPAALLKERVLPNLVKNRTRIPPEIQSLILKPGPVNS
jgi:HD-like signal output (HDOD) protein